MEKAPLQAGANFTGQLLLGTTPSNACRRHTPAALKQWVSGAGVRSIRLQQGPDDSPSPTVPVVPDLTYSPGDLLPKITSTAPEFMGSKPETGKIPAKVRPRSGRAGPQRTPPPAPSPLAMSSQKLLSLGELSREIRIR